MGTLLASYVKRVPSISIGPSDQNAELVELGSFGASLPTFRFVYNNLQSRLSGARVCDAEAGSKVAISSSS